jgi:hypothetical protein
MKKGIILLWVSTLFLVGCSDGNTKKELSKTKPNTTRNTISQQQKADTMMQKKYDETTIWESIHAKYAAKKYKLADEWTMIDFYNYGGDTEEANAREALWDVKIKLVGDSILYLNNKKVKVRRTKVDASEYKDKSYFKSYLAPFFGIRGINISKSVPVLQLLSSEEDIYSNGLKYIYTGKYLVLDYGGVGVIYKFISKNSKSLPSPTAKLEYTSDDMFKDVEKEKSTKNAQQYNIHEYKGKLKVLSSDRIEPMVSEGGFYFAKLPPYKNFPIFICYNYHEADIFTIYTLRNNELDNQNSVEISATDSYSDVTESFAIFTDGTIYVKTNNGKKSKITVNRISKEGDFYELK